MRVPGRGVDDFRSVIRLSIMLRSVRFFFPFAHPLFCLGMACRGIVSPYDYEPSTRLSFYLLGAFAVCEIYAYALIGIKRRIRALVTLLQSPLEL